MKIAAVVYNTVLHDARVIKEAESLKNAGHDVKLFGILDNNSTTSHCQTPDGVPVELVEWRDLHFQKKHNRVLKMAPLTFALTTAVLLWSYFSGFHIELLYFFLWLSISVACARVFYRHLIVNRKAIGHSATGGRSENICKLFFYDVVKFVYLKSKFNIYRDSIVERIKSFQPDVVHCHDLHSLPVGLKLIKRPSNKSGIR